MEHQCRYVLNGIPKKLKSTYKNIRLILTKPAPIFDDPLFITFLDEEHSKEEERFITIGLSNKHRILLVAHTESNENTRIVSARKVTKYEE